jgi:nucleoside-diphosphate-sugar epimerase
MALNVLWGLHEAGLDAHFIETATTEIYDAPEFELPEGGVDVKRGDDDVPFPAMGESWYRQSKAFDAPIFRLAAAEFDLDISEVRTAVVYGTETAETARTGLTARFDFDFYFGTVVNRFYSQAVVGHPLTVYDSGEQRKPMVGLRDAVGSLAWLVDDGPNGPNDDPTVYNQVIRPVAIVDLAETIVDVGTEFNLNVTITYVENPRKVDTQADDFALDTSAARETIGFEARRSVERTVRGLVQ